MGIPRNSHRLHFTVYKSEENNHQCDHFTAALNDYNRVCAEGELEANARLIAAAPRLLERAKALLANWENGNIGGYVQSLAHAIAEAEGHPQAPHETQQ